MPDRDPAAGDILTTNGPGPGQYGPLIYTPQGQLVWFDKLPGGETAEDLNEQTYEGQRDLTWWKGRVLSLGFGQGEDVVMNSHYQTVARVAGGNGLKADLHDFQIAPHDVAYITAFNPIRCDLTSVKGARDGTIVDTAIQEIDMKTGLVRWEWHSLDHVGASESETEAPAERDAVGLVSPQLDRSRARRQHLHLRAQHLGRLPAGRRHRQDPVAPGRARQLFKMGPGTRNGVAARRAHARRAAKSRSSTTAPTRRSTHSRVLCASRSNFKTHQARLAAAYTHSDPPLLAASQGNMQTLADGNTVVGYGGVPAISEYAEDGSLLFDAHLPYDMAFYRAFRFPWSGRPLSPPATARQPQQHGRRDDRPRELERRDGSRRLARARGQGLGIGLGAGDDPGGGFESSTTLPKKYARVAVQALDSRGRVLGTSRAMTVVSYAASLPEPSAVGMTSSVGGFGVVLVRGRRRGRGGRARRLRGRGARRLCRRTLPPRRCSPRRPGALAWRSVAFSSWAGLQLSLEGSGAHPTRRPRRQSRLVGRHERAGDG